MTTSDPLNRLASLAGVETSYEDAWGNPQRLARERIRALLAVLGIDTGDEEQVRLAIQDLETRPWRRFLPPVQVVRDGEPIEVDVVLPAGFTGRLRWRVETEAGEVHSGAVRDRDLKVVDALQFDRDRLERRRLRLPLGLPPGYHTLHLDRPEDRGDTGGVMQLIVAPRTCYLPPALAAGGRTWGFNVQLYGLRSERNWGIGDFTDLAALVEGARKLGAGLVGVNPLHAAFLSNPERASPYGPTSRLFLNVLYLDIERVPDFADSESARELVASRSFQEPLTALRDAELVDYRGVASCKLEVLELLYRSFTGRHLDADPVTERGEAFCRFQRERGPALRTQAMFDALAEHVTRERGEPVDWPDWPEPYRDPRSAAVRDFVAAAPDRVEFYEYLQWLGASQLHEVGQRCEQLGLEAGLYLDLAIGVGSNGADVWADQEAYVAQAGVGAPPDIWNPKGQNWDLPPLHPHVMRERAYAPLVAVLRANMRHAGALRIDHVLALMHLYWIPRGQTPDEGGFVRYPLDDLLGVVALESHRNRCLVIGEDLGTVPDAFRQRLQDFGVLSYRLLYFEKDQDGRFISPDAYPDLALASVTTHDLPTLPGYWEAHDLDLRSRLELFPSQVHQDDAYADRAQDRVALLEALRRDGLWAGAGDDLPDFGPDLVAAAYAYLARSPAMILMVHFEDVLGQRDQPNLPGTTEEHPNWQRKLPADLRDLLGDRRLRALVKRIRHARPGRAGG